MGIQNEFRLGERFRFGRNWQRFQRTLDERSITEAEKRLADFLGVSSLRGKTFLDVGSGSGLHSLAARRLDADVVSFDYDPESVGATRHLRDRFGFDENTWKVEFGSVLDTDYLSMLGKFDIVYSWGVLHHTGAMWEALTNVQSLIKENGQLYIAIYNDKGEESRSWLKIKKRYCAFPTFVKPLYLIWVYVPIELSNMNALKALRRGRIDKLPNKIIEYYKKWREYKRHRGMSKLYDMIDWIGGYPYEFAKADDLVSFYEAAGFCLMRLDRCEGTGNHELLFVKNSKPGTRSASRRDSGR